MASTVHHTEANCGFSFEQSSIGETTLKSAGRVLLDLFNNDHSIRTSPHSRLIRTIWLLENHSGIRLPELEDPSIESIVAKTFKKNDDIFALQYEPRSVMGYHTDNTVVTNLTIIGNGTMRVYPKIDAREEYEELDITPGTITRTKPDIGHIVINSDVPRIVLSSLPRVR